MVQKTASQHKAAPRLQAALFHPRRLAILGVLVGKRKATPDELREALGGLSLLQLNYHLMVLREVGLIYIGGSARDKSTRSYSLATPNMTSVRSR